MPPTFEPRETKSSAGPMVSIVIILMLMIAGAVYFWNEQENQKVDTIPYIPGDSSTTTSSITQTTSFG